jgi:MFS-type transporter involved in bile tolerance (Atg22 family)
VLAILIGSVPGAVLAGATVAWFNPVNSNMMAAFVIMANTIAAAIILKGPGKQNETYILALIWGLGTGWKRTTDRLLASILIPKGQDAELMGVFLFCGQSLTWLPPLIFTAVNEAGVSQRVGVGMLSIYFFIGLVSLSMIRNYREATVHRIPSPSTFEANGEILSVDLDVLSTDATISTDLAEAK